MQDSENVNHGAELVPAAHPDYQVEPAPPAVGLLAMGISPEDALENASHVAGLLTRVLRERGMLTVTGRDKRTGQPREHVNVEGWTTLGAMTGHTAVIEWTRPCEDENGEKGWEARAVLTDAGGQVVAAAEGMCTRSEKEWRTRDPFALRGMAQTRAISRAYRARLDFVVKMAGFQTTPDAEMPAEPTEEQLTQWLSEAISPLIEQFGRDAVTELWKREGRPWLHHEHDAERLSAWAAELSAARESTMAAEAPADQVERVTGDVVDAPAQPPADQRADDLDQLGQERFLELDRRARAAGIDDLADRLVAQFDLEQAADLADPDRWLLISAAVDGWISGKGRKK